MDKKTKGEEVVTAYKGFNKDLKCRDFQFEVGKTYEHSGTVEACKSGFHSCENPLDVWNYYGPCDARFAKVRVSGVLARHDADSKIASAKLTVDAEIGLPQFVGEAVRFLVNLCGSSKDGDTASGNSSQLAASGNSSQLAASGYSSKLAASGNSSKLAASGYSSQLAASGDKSIVVGAGPHSSAAAGVDGCIALSWWDDSAKRFRLAVGYVGEGIEANRYYGVNDKGEFVPGDEVPHD